MAASAPPKEGETSLYTIALDPESSIASDAEEAYGLEERTFRFAKAIRAFVKKLPNTIGHQEDVRQLIRASGSVAANFIEAVEGLSHKDYVYRLKICRKEAKESHLWLRLLMTEDTSTVDALRNDQVREAVELTRILSSIIRSKEGSGGKYQTAGSRDGKNREAGNRDGKNQESGIKPQGDPR